MKEKIYAHGDHIFEKNFKDGKLFFIRSGQIEYLLEFGSKTHTIKSKNVIKKIKKDYKLILNKKNKI
jgi:hypothetical protein